MTKPRKFTKGAVADAAWIAGFELGALWSSAFRPAREAELIALGVLVPTDQPGTFRTAPATTRTCAHVTPPRPFAAWGTPGVTCNRASGDTDRCAEHTDGGAA